jgi:predicted nucleic acid-binding protein
VIVLDTNVLSALMRADVEAPVERWIDSQPLESLWTTTVTVFEIRFGLLVLVPGRRRMRLEAAFREALDGVFGGRVVSFDEPAAEEAAFIAAERRKVGSPVEIRDLQIAGIVRAHKATLATRNLRHFEGVGIKLVDPWTF